MDKYTMFINDTETCCNKQRIKLLVYKFNGTQMSDRTCIIICINLCLLYFMTLDIILRTNIISYICKWMLFAYMTLKNIMFMVNIINIMLFVSIYYEIDLLMKAVNCEKCKVS